MRKRVWICTIALITAIIVIACNSGVRNGELSKIRVGYIPIADCSQLYVAIEKKFFEEKGIEVELVNMSGGAKILEALGTGSLDVGFSNVVSLILAHEAGLPFVAFTGGPAQDENHKEHAILVKKNSPIKVISDLSGQKIALNTRKNIDELMVTLLLQKYNVDPSTVDFVEVPFPRMLGVLENGNAQAIAAIEPFVTFGLSDEKNRVLTYNYLEIQPVTEISSYVSTKNWINTNKELVDGFQDAMRKAAVFANENEEEVRNILLRYTRLDESQVKEFTLPYFTESLSEERLNTMIQKVHDLGWIEFPFPAKDLIQNN